MAKGIRKRSTKAGLPPGTLIHIGEKRVEAIRITVIDYDEQSFQEKEVSNIEECLKLKNTPTVSWINIDGLYDIELLEKLGKGFEIHPLILEDILSTGQRPKFEDYEKYIFIVLKMLSFSEENQAKLSKKKRYIEDIIEPMKLISRLVGRGSKYAGTKQTTQFIVGAAGEPDAEIVKYMRGLYDRLKMNRVYFSAYQKGLGDESVAGEGVELERPTDAFVREHRLYQVDFLLRKYGFAESDIVFDEKGDLSLTTDPKEAWALRHPERFPVDVNWASRFSLLRVPGLGPVTVGRILERRKAGRIRCIEDVGKVGIRLEKAKQYLAF